MSTNTKANAELELRPLEDHELETVSGGNISAQQSAIRYHMGPSLTWGPGQWDFTLFKTLGVYEQVSSPVHLANWV